MICIEKIQKRLKPLEFLGLSLFEMYDPDWVRTSDPHPVKVVLSQLSYGIRIICSWTIFNIKGKSVKVKVNFVIGSFNYLVICSDLLD